MMMMNGTGDDLLAVHSSRKCAGPLVSLYNSELIQGQDTEDVGEPSTKKQKVEGKPGESVIRLDPASSNGLFGLVSVCLSRLDSLS